MRVLVVRLGAFGDIVHTLPLIADLRTAGHEVGFLCEDRFAALLDPGLVRLHILPRRSLRGASWATRWSALRRLIRELRAARYDIGIDAQGLAKSAALLLVSGAQRRVGFARPRSREGAALAAHCRVPTPAVHVINQQRGLGVGLGLRAQGGWRFPVPAWTAERAAAVAWLSARGLAAAAMLNVGAGWPTKVWPLAQQMGFAALLRARGQPLLLLWGSPAERAVAEQVAASGHGVLAPPTTIPELGGFLAAARVVISGDTGPLHLAFALGVPVVGLFGPVPATRNGPRGRATRTLQAPGAAWERRDVSKVDMGALTPEAVLAAADAAMSEAGSVGHRT